MKTDVAVVESNGKHLEYALNTIEGLAEVQKLSSKETMHLRLLAEEVFAIVRLAVRDFSARFWAEGEGKEYRLILESDVFTTDKEKSDLLSLASTGENEADLGIGQRLARMFRIGACGQVEDGYSWSLNNFKKELEESSDPSTALEHMEKSVIANLASNVRVSVSNGKIRLIVDKVF